MVLRVGRLLLLLLFNVALTCEEDDNCFREILLFFFPPSSSCDVIASWSPVEPSLRLASTVDHMHMDLTW